MASVNTGRRYVGHEHQVGVRQGHAVPGAAIGRGVGGRLYGCGVGETYRMAPTPAGEPVGKPRARKRAKGAPTHVRSWALRPDAAQCREIGTRFFTGVRVYNAVLGEFIARSRAVKADPAWQAARELPRRTTKERAARAAAFARCRAAGTGSPWMRRSPTPRPCASPGCVNICRPRRPRTWARGRLMRCVSGTSARRVSRGSRARAGVCIRWRPRTAMVRCDPRPMRRAAGRVAVGRRVRHPDRGGGGVGSARQGAAGRAGRDRGVDRRGQGVIDADRAHGDQRCRHLPHATGVRWAPDPAASGRRREGVVRPGTVADRGGRAVCRWELVGLGGAAGRCDPVGHDAFTPRAAASGSPAPRRITRTASPKMASTPLVAVGGGVRPPRSRPRCGWPSCIVAWPSIAERCMGRWVTACWATAPTSPVSDWIMCRGRRTSRAVCATGHRGYWWR